ncbi:ATP-dependent Clp protease ATP-binding subunit ClpA homolog CD4B, chloroplastic-like protein [Tanacetum coccineum]
MPILTIIWQSIEDNLLNASSATSTADPFAQTVHTGNNEQHHSQNVKTLKDFKGCDEAKQELEEVTLHVFGQNSNEQRLVTRDFAHVPSMAGALIHAACFAAVDRQKKLLTNGTGKTVVDFHFKIIASSVRRKRVSRVVPKAMFELFTKKAIKVIMLAQAEAHRLGHNFVGTKHILLGRIGEGTGIAAKV